MDQLKLRFSTRNKYLIHFRLGYRRGGRVVIADNEEEAVNKLWCGLLLDGTFCQRDYENNIKWHYVAEVTPLEAV